MKLAFGARRGVGAVGESKVSIANIREDISFLFHVRCLGCSDMQRVSEHEISFDTMRSSGSGGQSVNTTDSAVRGVWNISKCFVGSAEEKVRVLAYLEKNHPKHIKFNDLGEALLVAKSQTQKSQLQNKGHVIDKMNELLAAALEVREERIDAMPRSVKRRINRARLQEKSRTSTMKKLRKNTDSE